MRYTSGKTFIGGGIAKAIFQREKSGSLVSLFCGGLSVERALSKYFDVIICNDKQEYLIALYQAVQSGWIPPEEITEEQYKYVRDHKDESKPLSGFVGFGCSFGAKWFAGYGRSDRGRFPCAESRRAVLRDINTLKDTLFTNLDYRDVTVPERCIVYADPPYIGKTTGYGLKESFDTAAFWQWCRDVPHKVYVSELTAPNDFVPVWEHETRRQMSEMIDKKKRTAVERLYIHERWA